jgi:hypothetical protein
MATYTYRSPDSSDKDAIRFLLGDTTEGEWLLSDQEITFSAAKWKPIWGTNEYVASILAENIAAKYSREAQISADGVSIGLGAVAQQFRDLALSLREQHSSLLVGGLPDVGGISPDEGLYVGVRPFTFGTRMHDFDEAGSQDYGGVTPLPYPVEEYPG